jgi:hypothetical protein
MQGENETSGNNTSGAANTLTAETNDTNTTGAANTTTADTNGTFSPSRVTAAAAATAAAAEIPGITCVMPPPAPPSDADIAARRARYDAASLGIASGNVSMVFVSPNATRSQVLIARLGTYRILLTVEDGCFRQVIETTVVVAWNPMCVAQAAQLSALVSPKP